MSASDAAKGRRAPPAFQMYASDRLADRDFKAMSVAERGLLHSMELECWVNGSVPSDIRDLARVLGLEPTEVEAGITVRIMRRFARFEGSEGEVIVCPELDAYRGKLEERHAKMSSGGKQSAEAINRRRQHTQTSRPADSLADSHPDSQADSPLSREEQSRAEQSRASLENGPISEEHEEWIKQYEGGAFEAAGTDLERAPAAMHAAATSRNHPCPRCDGEGCRFCADRSRMAASA